MSWLLLFVELGIFCTELYSSADEKINNQICEIHFPRFVRQCWSCTIAEHIAALYILLVACAALRGANNMSGESGSDILLSIRPRRVPQAWNGAPGFDHFSPPYLVMYSQAQSTTYHFPLFTLLKLQILCTLYINTSLQLHRRAVLTEEVHSDNPSTYSFWDFKPVYTKD